MELTQQTLKQMLSYSEHTGQFTWETPSKYRPEYQGKIAGSLHSVGYIHISILGKSYKAHRLAWLYVHGVWPLTNLDHINGDRADNRISNLREATHAQNAQNRKHARRGHTLGVLGVVWRERNKKYEARIHIEGKYKYLGLFATAEEAHAAYLTAKRAAHPFFTTIQLEV
jgi:hypothetical protein